MPDDREPVPPQRTRRTLPPEAVAGLREAFADEVRARLPRLLALLDGPPGPDVLRDAHALASSAVVVGELDASRSARALEVELSTDRPDPAVLHPLVHALAGHLRAWAPA